MQVPTRQEVIEQVRQAGNRIAAVLPIHYPRALLRAYGFHPIEVWGPPGAGEARDDGHFQDYTCAVVQHATRFLTEGAGRQVDCILIPHTCDALQGMASVFQDFIQPPQPVLTVYHPRARRDADLEFLTRELERLGEKLGAISGRAPTEADLDAAIRAEDAADAAFADLQRNRAQVAATDREFYTCLRAREYLTAEAFVELAGGLPRGEPPTDGVALMLGGIVPEPMTLFDHITSLGARIVADDLACCGRRVYTLPDDPDPFRRMAGHLMSMPHDPTLGMPIEPRNAFLIEEMRRSGARGMLVYDVKFCEPELFYLPLLTKAFKAEGWPVLHVEVELGTTIPQQVLNRIDAFVEVLQ